MYPAALLNGISVMLKLSQPMLATIKLEGISRTFIAVLAVLCLNCYLIQVCDGTSRQLHDRYDGQELQRSCDGALWNLQGTKVVRRPASDKYPCVCGRLVVSDADPMFRALTNALVLRTGSDRCVCIQWIGWVGRMTYTGPGYRAKDVFARVFKLPVLTGIRLCTHLDFIRRVSP